jgi:tetratricopeptide (TPR) repeat protein
MKQYKNRPILPVLFCLFIFTSIPLVYGQDYNPNALRYFKSSIENLMKGDYDQAVEDSSRVIKIDPESAVSYVIRARAYFEMGDFDSAIADSTEAIKRDRNNVGAYTIRANAQGKKGNTTRAIADWNAVLRINPNADDARLNIERARQQISATM